MVNDPANSSGTIVYIDWVNNSAETNAELGSLVVPLFYSQSAGTPTITAVQGTGWSTLNSFTAAQVSSSGVSNPNSYAYIQIVRTSLLNFGDVSTANQVDTIFKLNFPSGSLSTYTARLVEGNNGSGGSALDNYFTGAGYKPVNEYNHAISIPKSYTAYDGIQESVNIPVPVELLSFEANLMNDKDVAVRWETASELNNDYFQVERIMEGEERFTSVGSLVPGAGTTSARQYYSLLDTEVSWISPNAYYRLLQVDYDGTISYSDLEVVSFGRDNRILLYPNPTTGEVNILMTSKEDTKITVSNVFGQDMTDQVKLRKSSNGVVVDMSGAALGTYFIHVTTETSNSTKKVVLVN
jgi:hypothetical protein